MDNLGFVEDANGSGNSPFSSKEGLGTCNEMNFLSTSNATHNESEIETASKLVAGSAYTPPNAPKSKYDSQFEFISNYIPQKIFLSSSFRMTKPRVLGRQRRFSESFASPEVFNYKNKEKLCVDDMRNNIKPTEPSNKILATRKRNSTLSKSFSFNCNILSDQTIQPFKAFQKSFSLNNKSQPRNKAWKTDRLENKNMNISSNHYCCETFAEKKSFPLEDDYKISSSLSFMKPIESSHFNDNRIAYFSHPQRIESKVENGVFVDRSGNIVSSSSDLKNKCIANIIAPSKHPDLPIKPSVIKEINDSPVNNITISTISGSVPMYYSNYFPHCSSKSSTDNRRNLKWSTKFFHPSDKGKYLQNARLVKRDVLGGWKLHLISNTASRKTTALCLIMISACFLLLVATSLVFYLCTTTSNSSTFEWKWDVGESGVNVVGGEFKISNINFTPAIKDLNSSDSRELANDIVQQLDVLFSASSLTTHFNHSHVIQLRHISEDPSPQQSSNDIILVQCKLVFSSVPSHGTAANLAGLEFLKGLEHHHGQMWLGKYAVDIRSIKFIAIDENLDNLTTIEQPPDSIPGWSEWSEWTQCNMSASSSTPTQSRTRVCRLNRGQGETLASIEPCLLVEESRGNLEVRDCNDVIAATVMSANVFEEEPDGNIVFDNDLLDESFLSSDSTIVAREVDSMSVIDSTLKNTSYPETEFQYNTEVEAILENNASSLSLATIESDMKLQQNIEELVPATYKCDKCDQNEVCVALSSETVPVCREAVDSNDPTGCGGFCLIGVEVCHKLDGDTFYCAEDTFCLVDEWRCGNKLCIPKAKRCDGHMNCYDHTDEFDCECDLGLSFHCGNNTSCLPKEKRCDGIIDCWDGVDESNCTTACPNETQFTCNNGQCIQRERFCDGYADCEDMSDEPFGCGGKCKNHEWECGNGRCIVKWAVCDGIDTCGDLSDENNCHKIKVRNQ